MSNYAISPVAMTRKADQLAQSRAQIGVILQGYDAIGARLEDLIGCEEELKRLAAQPDNHQPNWLQEHDGGWTTAIRFLFGQIPYLEVRAPGGADDIQLLRQFLQSTTRSTGFPPQSSLFTDRPDAPADLLWIYLGNG